MPRGDPGSQVLLWVQIVAVGDHEVARIHGGTVFSSRSIVCGLIGHTTGQQRHGMYFDSSAVIFDVRYLVYGGPSANG